MPSQTFLNLPEAKRQRFVEIAIEEFANHHYRSASISRLVVKAGIAKGSFYQYFRNKKDLYMYLIEMALQAKLDFLTRYHQQANREGGFFHELSTLLQASAAFDLARPKLSRLISRALHSDLPYRDEIIRRVKEVVQERARRLVKDGAEHGDLRPGLDQDLVAFVITVLATEFGGYLAQRLGAEAPDASSGQQLPQLVEGSGQRLFEQLVNMLQHGVGSGALA